MSTPEAAPYGGNILDTTYPVLLSFQPLGPQELLDYRITGTEVDPPALVGKLMAEPAQQIGLATARIAKGRE